MMDQIDGGPVSVRGKNNTLSELARRHEQSHMGAVAGATKILNFLK